LAIAPRGAETAPANLGSSANLQCGAKVAALDGAVVASTLQMRPWVVTMGGFGDALAWRSGGLLARG
jgi:hypothetical protein